MPVTRKIGVAAVALLALSACEGVDIDLRDQLGAGAADTTSAAQRATAPRPEADDRGIISYPNYQVVVARRNDTVASVAERLGLTPAELARFNGLTPDTTLRRGEILALPGRVAEPVAPRTDITDLAAGAIERAPADAIRPAEVAATALPSGPEPIRHQVERGETAFSISRLYGVPVRSLAEWNSLPADLSVREGQYLLIPVATADTAADVTEPGQGTATPTPPSSTRAQPAEDTSLSDQAPQVTETATQPEAQDVGLTTPDVGQTTQTAAKSDFRLPVQGSIIRAYQKGRNEGIDIGAPAGTNVGAAGAGSVVAVQRNANNEPVLVIRHDGQLMTVYTQISDVTVKVGDRVSRGQTIGKVAAGSPSFVHFEFRSAEDLESINPSVYLNI
ncbi:LysM peptidoglycan-binding domain-containing M23 family metallopeptidase [Shimia ponticola]|uniref:LysM peptidoglycan-binding domain-containing M23 family metallopeptidase n=1 Tax=Shimia ponticola TaxID=2582893 RepID=UPI0011BF25E4|nr:LysM peptidoglycan-binding domain-containing M23 family metallopeptidase [Shimia ponticola]